jgi:DNA-binding CsgD family transcriptional regulator
VTRDAAAQGDDEFLSAIQRLPNPVFTWNGAGPLRPVNAAGQRLAREEHLDQAFDAASIHPLARLLRKRIASATPAALPDVVELADGRKFEVDISTRSTKGAGRLLIVILRDLAAARRMREEEQFNTWELTEREKDVARALLEGRSSEDIRSALGISANTLKSHIARLLLKSGAKSRAELLAKTRD